MKAKISLTSADWMNVQTYLAPADEDGNINYMQFLEDYHLQAKVCGYMCMY
jgi:hypothetical protein